MKIRRRQQLAISQGSGVTNSGSVGQEESVTLEKLQNCEDTGTDQCFNNQPVLSKHAGMVTIGQGRVRPRPRPRPRPEKSHKL